MKKETSILKYAMHKSIDIFLATKNGSSDNGFIQAGFKAICQKGVQDLSW